MHTPGTMLTHVDIHYHEDPTKKIIPLLLSGCKGLVSLACNAEGYRDEDFTHLGTFKCSLKSLSLVSCMNYFIGNRTLDLIAECMGDNLETVDLSGHNLMWGDDLVDFVTTCTKIREFVCDDWLDHDSPWVDEEDPDYEHTLRSLQDWRAIRAMTEERTLEWKRAQR